MDHHYYQSLVNYAPCQWGQCLKTHTTQDDDYRAFMGRPFSLVHASTPFSFWVNCQHLEILPTKLLYTYF